MKKARWIHMIDGCNNFCTTEHEYEHIYYGYRDELTYGTRTMCSNSEDVDMTVLTVNAKRPCSYIYRESWIERGDIYDNYSQGYMVHPPEGNVRYIKSGECPVAKLEYIDDKEYRFYGNPFFMIRIESEYITVKGSGDSFGFYDGEKMIGETRLYQCEGVQSTKSIFVGFNKAAYLMAHLLILPVYDLLFKPYDNDSKDSTQDEIRFERVNNAANGYLDCIEEAQEVTENELPFSVVIPSSGIQWITNQDRKYSNDNLNCFESLRQIVLGIVEISTTRNI